MAHFAAYCSAVCAGQAAEASTYLDRLHAVADDVRLPPMRWTIGVLDGFVATMEASFADGRARATWSHGGPSPAPDPSRPIRGRQ